MAETKFEMKVKEAIKPIEEICDTLLSCTKSELSKGIDKVDTKELGEVLDGIKDMCDAKEKVVKAMYYTEIGSAMEENADDYGETWDEEGPMRKGYNSRRYPSSGRYASKGHGMRYGYEDRMMHDDRDMDRMNGRMYYTEARNVPDVANEMRQYTDSGRGGNYYENRNYTEMGASRMERARRNYEEHMKKHDTSDAGKKKEMELLENFIDSATEVMMAYKPEMDSATKTMMSKKLSNAGAKVMQ